MNKTDLIDQIAKKTEMSKAAAGRALDTVIESIVKAVAKGDNVTIVGFGTFKASKRAARAGRNPRTGKTIRIPAATVPRFSAGLGFKEAVAGQKSKKR